MNREIKFRIWDKFLNKFHFPELDFEWNRGQPLFGFYCSSGNYADFEDNWKDNFIFQEFTGLKDKNNKEIYEGDLIRNGKFKPVQVVYDAYYGGFFPFFMKVDEERETLANNPEIVGNIFENPELLK
jgi:uncharacterized phage protein (TIGR01671 family)